MGFVIKYILIILVIKFSGYAGLHLLQQYWGLPVKWGISAVDADVDSTLTVFRGSKYTYIDQYISLSLSVCQYVYLSERDKSGGLFKNERKRRLKGIYCFHNPHTHTYIYMLTDRCLIYILLQWLIYIHVQNMHTYMEKGHFSLFFTFPKAPHLIYFFHPNLPPNRL